MKVAVIGSRSYQNYMKIKNIIGKLKKEHGDELIIVSGGNLNGADKFVKEISWELGIRYVEFPPYHYKWNTDCQFNGIEKFKYDQPYKVKNFFIRNEQLVNFSDIVIAFFNKNNLTPGTKHVINTCKKKNKKYLCVF